jgi:hypothetical protein
MTEAVVQCPICSRTMADEEELLAHFRDDHPGEERPASS